MFAIGGKKDQAKAAAAKQQLKPGYQVGASSVGGGVAGGIMMGGMKLPGGAKLSMYANAPAAEVALEDFELYALDRMRVLKAIDDGLSRGKKPAEMETLIQAEVDKHLRTVDPYSGKPVDDAALTKDEVSHFALRLAYCRTEELRRWFLMQECALFRHRFRRLAGYAQAAFLAENGLDYRPITPEASD